MYYENGEERFGYFGSKAYSFLASIALRGYYSKIARDIIARKPEVVLDVGGGTGNLLSLLAYKLKSSRFYYVDPSRDMLPIARKRFARNRVSGRIKIALGSSTNVPFSGKFDLIVSSFSFHHWAKKREGVMYLLKKLDKNGRLVIYDLDSSALRGPYVLARGHAVSEDAIKKIIIPGVKTETKRIGNLLVAEFWKPIKRQ